MGRGEGDPGTGGGLGRTPMPPRRQPPRPERQPRRQPEIPDEVRERIVALWNEGHNMESIRRRLSYDEIEVPGGARSWDRWHVKRVLQEAGIETAYAYPPVPAATVERIEELVGEGLWPDEIAKQLNREGVPVVSAKQRELTYREGEGKWGGMPVMNILRRLGYTITWTPPNT